MGIKFIKGSDADLNYSHKLLDRMDKVGQDSVHHFTKNFLAAETVPDFYTIEIETVNRCNNDCPFCPVNRNNDTRKPAVMTEEIFYSVIDQLRAMDYHGNINLFSNNEPLLDGRILKFVEHTRKLLPYAHCALYTNGILLTEEKFSSLVKNLNLFLIDNYDDNFELIPSVKKVFDNTPPLFPISEFQMRRSSCTEEKKSETEHPRRLRAQQTRRGK